MPSSVEVVVEEARWTALGIESLAKGAIEATFHVTDIQAAEFEVSLLACGDRKVSELNLKFRDKGEATNVLSWPAFNLSPRAPGARPTKPPRPQSGRPAAGLGDIAIAYETCLREAEDRGLSMADHATHLIVHGCLHLLGYDHVRDADATVMETLEAKALASMGIQNPY